MTTLKIIEIIFSTITITVFLLVIGDLKRILKKTLLFIIPIVALTILLNLFIAYKNPNANEIIFITTTIVPMSCVLLLQKIVIKKQLITILTGVLNAFLGFYIVYSMKNSFQFFVNNKILLTIIIYVISTPILVAFYRLFYVRLQSLVEEYLPKAMWLLLIYGFVMLLEIAIYSLLTKKTSQRILRVDIFIVSILSVYFISITGFYIFISRYKNKSLQLVKLENEKKQVDLIVEQQNKEIENNDKLKIVRHDMKHVLNIVSTLIQEGKYNDALNEIKKYTDVIEDTKNIVYCKDSSINSIICYYEAKCKQNDITLKIKINNILDCLNIPIEDLSVILSNVLENAFNASLKSNKKQINFKFLNNNDRLILQVSNSYDGIIELNKNVPVTHVKGHGTGTKSIQYFAKKNNLVVDYDIKKDTFKITILFN